MRGKGHRSRIVAVVCGLLWTCVFWAGPSLASERATVEAILVRASHQPGRADRRLAAVESQLRQVFQFQSYEVLGIQRQNFAITQQVRLDLGHGYAVNVHSQPGNGRIRAQIEWFHTGTRLLNTSIHQARGVPAILGGPPHDGGTLILILQFE